MKRCLALSVIAIFVLAPIINALAEGKADPNAVRMFRLTGKLDKLVDISGKAQYTITNEKSTLALTLPDGAEKNAKFSDFVGMNVELIGKGTMTGTVTDKNRDVKVTEVTSLKKLEDKNPNQKSK